MPTAGFLNPEQKQWLQTVLRFENWEVLNK